MRRFVFIAVALIASTFVFGDIVFASEPGVFARTLGIAYDDTRLLVIRVAQIIWFFVCVGAIGVLIYGFILYRRANPEDPDEETHARRIMYYSGIAAAISLLLIIVLTFAYVMIERGYQKTRGGAKDGRMEGAGLGSQILIPESSIRDHYPLRDERNVSRDTALVITFANPIRKESVLDATNVLRQESILIRRSQPTRGSDFGIVAATGVLSIDGKMLKILPSILLGQPDQKILYTVILTQEIKTDDGRDLFPKTESGYSWEFEVSGTVDTTPPTVTTYLPLAHSRNPINTLIQVTFSEPIDPFSIVTPDAVTVLAGTEGMQKPIEGTVVVGNAYRTMTFSSRTSCGTNQCGNTIYCLDGNTTFLTRIKAAALKGQISARDNPNKAAFPYGGLVDMAGNSFDGGGLDGGGRNGKSEGAEADDFFWSFATATDKETMQPTLVSLQPDRDAQGVNLSAPVTAVFSTFMDIASLNSATIGFSEHIPSWVSSAHQFSERRTRVQIHHDPFIENRSYTPVVRSGVRDIYQNCYNPCTGPGMQNP